MESQQSMVNLAVLLFFLLLQSTSGKLSSPVERAALLDLRSSLGLKAQYWPKQSDPCLKWFGVECRNGRVVGINISGLRRTHSGGLNPQFSVDALANLTLLESFNSSGFSLPGPIPDWFGQRLPSLQMLDLRSCSIEGPIPLSFGNLSNLNFLYLSDNNITGIIPSTLGQLSGISVLDLSHNLLTGSIPSTISSLRNITFLDLSSNFLSGPIPPAVGTLSNLQDLNLSGNSLSSSVPDQLSDLARLVNLDLSVNSLSGSLPENLFSGLLQLQFVVLSHNNFSGSLPALFSSVPGLRFLDVSNNNLLGFLPNLSSNTNATIAVFNFSYNQFYGDLTSLHGEFSSIDLSDNYFQGKVPNDASRNSSLARNCLQNQTNQKSLEDCTSFYANIGLSFDNFGDGEKSKKRLTFILVGVFGGLGFVVLLALMLALFLCTRGRGNSDRRRTSVRPIPAGRSPPPTGMAINLYNMGEFYTYEQLLRAAGDFGHSNLIKNGHTGDVFQGILDGGIPIVIKRIDVRSFKKELYMVELDLFSRVSHKRLVPLLGHCLKHENEKLLVYKYMPNSDLSSSLYRKTNSEDDRIQSLDWITRLKIAIGAAEGLSYLHHEFTPPLVHRDVQASSILLDDKFEVRLGSLSEVRTQEGGCSHQKVISRLLRLPQSSEQGASPSGIAPATCAYDVYCFGKVLLELVTGKLGISASDETATKEWLEPILPYINIYEKEPLLKIVDPSLILNEDLIEEVWAMAIIARSCLNSKPSKRPLMKYVLKALENPLKILREENSRITSSRGSWSWNHSSSDIKALQGSNNREELRNLKQKGRVNSHGSGGFENSSFQKRIQGDIFPELGQGEDIERQDEDQ